MDSITVKNIFTEEIVKIDLKIGSFWFIAIDKPNEKLLPTLEFLNNQEQAIAVYVLLLDDSEILNSWIRRQSIQLNCVIATDSDIKEKLGIEETPWYASFKDGKVLYSSEKSPIDLYASFNESLPELDSPIKTNFESPMKANIFDSTFQNSRELPNSSISFQQSTEKQLEKALKKIEKLKLKVKEQEQTIEDFKSEMKQLKFLLGSKKPSNKLINDEPMNRVSLLNTNKLDSFQKKKNKINNISLRNDENDFWNINDNDLYESFKFEEAAGKDLWLMKLFNKHDSPKYEKNTKILPPLQQFETQNKGLKGEQNKYKTRSQSNKATKLTKKNLKKLY